MATRVRRRPEAPHRVQRHPQQERPSALLLAICSGMFTVSMVLSLLLLFAR